jgi:hypothetical protein
MGTCPTTRPRLLGRSLTRQNKSRKRANALLQKLLSAGWKKTTVSEAWTQQARADALQAHLNGHLFKGTNLQAALEEQLAAAVPAEEEVNASDKESDYESSSSEGEYSSSDSDEELLLPPRRQQQSGAAAAATAAALVEEEEVEQEQQ